MSTFSEGEVLSSITAFSGNPTTSDVVVYTCPSGKYAKISFSKLKGAASDTLFLGTLSINDDNIYQAANSIVLSSGQTLTLKDSSAPGGSYIGVALEYLNP